VIALLSLSLLTGCVTGNAQALEPTASHPATEAAPQLLTPEEAEAIAFAHALVEAGTVSRLRTEFGYDDGTPEYDIEFDSGDREYDYEIHAETGAVLRFKAEPAERPAPTESPAPKTSEPPATEASKAERLTKEEARDIALKHAGLTKDQVSRLKVEFDYDDGVPEYDVEFVCNGWEYDYEIHAESGKIRAWDKEWDD
jgi:uncharacterized membrane protein YkoI